MTSRPTKSDLSATLVGDSEGGRGSRVGVEVLPTRDGRLERLVETVDQIVERVDRDGGRFSALLSGVIESAPFQKRRDVATVAVGTTRTSKLNVEGRVKP